MRCRLRLRRRDLRADVDRPERPRAAERDVLRRRRLATRQPRRRCRRRAVDGAAYAEHRERADGRLRHRGRPAHAVHVQELVAALVLAIEPDLRQATILKRIVRDKVHADVAVVESPDAALAAIGTRIPDVLLLSALLSPRDEDELIAHLRGLDGADHIQTHTIPQLASTAADQEPGGRRGLLGVFKRKKEAPQPIVSGCDPDHLRRRDLDVSPARRGEESRRRRGAAIARRSARIPGPVEQTAGRAARDELVRPSPTRPSRRPIRSQPLRGHHRSNGGRVPRSESRVPSPKSQVPSPKSQVPSPKSQVPSPKSQVPSPKSQVPSPKSQVPGPSRKSRVHSPRSRVDRLESRGIRSEPRVVHCLECGTNRTRD